MLDIPVHLLDYRGAAELQAEILRALEPAPDLLVSKWADLFRVLNKKHTKEAGDWSTDRVPFMREPMDCLSARSPVTRVVIMKGAQVSGTESGLNWVGYTIDSDPAPMLFVSPTLTVTKRTSARVQSMIDDDPKRLGTKVLPARKADSKNSQFEKHFPGGALYFATAKSAANLRSTAAKKIVYDEVEAFPQDVDGEGGAVEVSEARGFTFGDQVKALLISTPGVDQTSIIKPEFNRGDQRLYHMPCPHPRCRKLIVFSEEKFSWTEGKPKTVHMVCEHCKGKILEGRHKKRMLAEGIWIPKALYENAAAMQRLEAGDRSELDAFNEDSLVRSYHLSSWYSPVGWLSWTKIIGLWEAAQGLPHKMKSIVNTIFGRTWVEAGEAPQWEVVYGRRSRSYRMREIPKGVVFLTAGADVGHDHVEISVWGWGRKRQRWLIEHIRIDGAYNEPETWEQVTAAIERRYLHPCGAVLHIRRFGIDRNAWPGVVDPWVMEQDRSRVVAVRGSDSLDGYTKWSRRKPKPGDPTPWGASARFEYVTVGSSFMKLELYACLGLRLVEGQDLPKGWIHLAGDISEEYAKQLVSERLTFEGRKGKRAKGTWVPVGAARHEALDCAVYARAMAHLVGWDRWSDHDFDREERLLLEAARDLELVREAQERDRRAAGDDTPVTNDELIHGLVLPEVLDAAPKKDKSMPAKISLDPVARREAEDEAQRPAPVAAPKPLVTEAPADPKYVGVRKTWAKRGGGGWGGPKEPGIVRCTDRAQGSLIPKSAPRDDDDDF